MDLSVLWPAPVEALTAAAAVVAAVTVVVLLRRREARTAVVESAQVALPFATPALVILGAAVLAAATRALGSPVRGPGGSFSRLGFFGGLNNVADESASAFGPLGGVVLFGTPLVAAVVALRRRVDPRRLVLAAALPSFLILLALEVKFNPWYSRFLIVPAALTAPLLAELFRSRPAGLAYLAVGAFLIALGITRLDTKPLLGRSGRPWNLSVVGALAESFQAVPAAALARYDELVPPRAAVGAVLSDGDPSFLLGGTDLRRRVVYLPRSGALAAARASNLRYVVIADQPRERPAARPFAAAGWRVRALAGYWLLAIAPGAAAA
jgi:hypothetical protein